MYVRWAGRLRVRVPEAGDLPGRSIPAAPPLAMTGPNPRLQDHARSQPAKFSRMLVNAPHRASRKRELRPTAARSY